MKKDIIYIEPEDDITSIIGRIKASEQKIIALVANKKNSALKSSINFKLLAKSAISVHKNLVIVTDDTILIKLAFLANLPVARDLNSRPAFRESDLLPKTPQKPGFANQDGESSLKNNPSSPNQSSGFVSLEGLNDDEIAITDAFDDDIKEESPKDENKIDNDIKLSSKNDLDKNYSKKLAPLAFLQKNRKWFILGSAVVAVFAIFLTWALIFAPSVKIDVSVRAVTNNFSENIELTTDSRKQDLDKSILFIEEHKYEEKLNIELTATGKKNVGNKAKGKLKISLFFNLTDPNPSEEILAGTIFKSGELSYKTKSQETIVWDKDSEKCENTTQAVLLLIQGCKISKEAEIEAVEPGEKYNNISSLSNSTIKNKKEISVSSKLSGGTDKMITIVTQQDVESAKKDFKSEGESASKVKLLETLPKDSVAIENSFQYASKDAAPSPKIGEEVKEGITPTLELKNIATINYIDKTKVEEYIKLKTKDKIQEDQAVYAVDTPFIERFVKNSDHISAKLKSTTKVGPKVTEHDILEKSKGKKIGEVQPLIKAINGVSKVEISPSYFFVTSVPTDPNKITIKLKVE